MKAVLSGETATFAVPVGQPDPLTDTTSITILSGGGTPSRAAARGENDVASSAAAAPHIITDLNTKTPSPAFRSPAFREPIGHVRDI
ncbi:hypothetical protein GCM10010319_64750 [Streptomyces blastmyceticus]|uniref:Uncharacterized protein n=1 Tax=Streptomyces blastmyceticus TaxID=68180 RepID=A0ABP3HQJ3_9ACTN